MIGFTFISAWCLGLLPVTKCTEVSWITARIEFGPQILRSECLHSLRGVHVFLVLLSTKAMLHTVL